MQLAVDHIHDVLQGPTFSTLQPKTARVHIVTESGLCQPGKSVELLVGSSLLAAGHVMPVDNGRLWRQGEWICLLALGQQPFGLPQQPCCCKDWGSCCLTATCSQPW